MPALSKKQQKFMGIVRSIQKGEQPASKFNKDAQDVAKDMKKKDVKKFASTKHKGLPMKKEILGKLKELIKQELSEYTYGVGDVVKDVNPTCPHHGAQGKVKSVNPRSVVFVVMNKGKNFKPGQELEKSHDQMKKMNESVNEMSAKSKKIINKLGKKEKEMFMDMVDMMGFDQVMMDYKKDKKAFKQALKDMSESVIQERNDEVQTGKEYTKLWLQSIGLIIKQANSLKGELAKHPIKRDLNKLKAVQNLFKKFIKPAVEREGKDNRHYAPNQTKLRKYLSDSKFKITTRILKQTLTPANGYDENSFYYLGDKEKKLLEKMSKVLYDIENKLDNANLENVNESINEDGHTDVASAKRKAMLMVEYSNKLLNKLNGMNKEDSLPSWLSDKITLASDYLHKATHYLLNPVESVNEKYKKLHPKEKIIVNFRNKKKGFKPDKKVFNDYEKAVKWGRKNVAKFHSDMISFEIPESVNENLRPSDKKILMVIATELVKTQMKGKNKNQIRKELPNILSTMGTNDFSKKRPTNRFNKNKMISLGKGFDKLSDSDKKVFINTLMYNAGLAESINEKKKMFPPDKMTPKQAKEYKRFIDYAKMGIEYKIDMSLFESINESKEPEVITQLRDIVKRKTNKKIKDPKTKKTMRVDMQTANVITQVYDAVKKTSHKSKFESLPLDKMAQLSFKMIK